MQLSEIQKWWLVLIALIVSIGILFCGLKGRYVWVQGQNNIHGKDFMPRILDTWTGKSETVF